MDTMTTRQALRRDDQGLCSRCEIEVDDEGTPVDPIGGYQYRRAGSAGIRGWGELDGLAAEWTHLEADPDQVPVTLLIPASPSDGE